MINKKVKRVWNGLNEGFPWVRHSPHITIPHHNEYDTHPEQNNRRMIKRNIKAIITPFLLPCKKKKSLLTLGSVLLQDVYIYKHTCMDICACLFIGMGLFKTELCNRIHQILFHEYFPSYELLVVSEEGAHSNMRHGQHPSRAQTFSKAWSIYAAGML